MSFPKGSALVVAIILIIIPNSFISGSGDFLYNGEFPESEIIPNSQPNIPFMFENGHQNFANVYNGDSYDIEVTTPANSNYIPYGLTASYYYPNQPDIVIPSYGGPYEPPEDAITYYNPQSTLQYFDSNQGLANLPNPGQSHQYQGQYQQFGDEIIQPSGQTSGNLNSSNLMPPDGESPMVVEISDELRLLPNISNFTLELKQKMINDGFCVSGMNLSHRTLSKTNTDFPNAIAYSPFFKGSSKSLWGRTGEPELHIYYRSHIISLFEMKAGFNPPKRFRYQAEPQIDELEEAFVNVNWSIHIRPSGKAAKIGADHSKVMALWAVTEGEIKEIDLKDQFIRESCLKKGGLIVAIPKQLNYIMKKVGKNRTYQEFNSFISPYVNLGLDTLMFIVEVCGGVATEAISNEKPNNLIGVAHSSQVIPDQSSKDTALEPSNANSSRARISDLGPELKKEIKGLSFRLSEGLKLYRHQIIANGSPNSGALLNGSVYCYFFNRSRGRFWGRTGSSELYIRVSQPYLSLFEAKADFNVPKELIQEKLTPNEAKAVFDEAKWSIHIMHLNQIKKTGADPSGVVTVWTVTSRSVEQIDLKGQHIEKELPLQKGDLIVVIPTHLNQIMQPTMAGKTYEEFLGFIEEFIDMDLDQLIVVLEVHSTMAARKPPVNKTSGPMNQSDVIMPFIEPDSVPPSENINFDFHSANAPVAFNHTLPSGQDFIDPAHEYQSNMAMLPHTNSYWSPGGINGCYNPEGSLELLNHSQALKSLSNAPQPNVVPPTYANYARQPTVVPPTHAIYARQPNVVRLAHIGPNPLSKRKNLGSHANHGSILLGRDTSLSDRNSTYPSNQKQPDYDLLNRMLHEGNRYHNPQVDFNPRDLPVASNSPGELPILARISDLGPELKKEIKGLSFRLSEGLKLYRHQIIANGSPNTGALLNGSVYCYFFNRSRGRFWGRTGSSELYIRVSQPYLSLFEAKADFNVPKELIQEKLTPNEVKAVLDETKWNIHIKHPDQIKKTGADPSGVVTVWTVTSKSVEQIDLKGEHVLKKLALQKGDLIVVIPTHLSHIMQPTMVGKTYEEFLGFIEEFIDMDLDQLIVVLEVYNTTTAQVPPGPGDQTNNAGISTNLDPPSESFNFGPHLTNTFVPLDSTLSSDQNITSSNHSHQFNTETNGVLKGIDPYYNPMSDLDLANTPGANQSQQYQ